MLSALNDMRPAADSGDNALRAAVSNIAAVRVPGGTSSAFQVSGTFSKLPGGEVRLATGGGGGGGKGRETRVGAELFRGEKGAKLGGLTGPAGGGGKIRGAVKSAGAPVTRGGLLDAAAVQRVVSEHLGAIQGCYERQLLEGPGAAGQDHLRLGRGAVGLRQLGAHGVIDHGDRRRRGGGLHRRRDPALEVPVARRWYRVGPLPVHLPHVGVLAAARRRSVRPEGPTSHRFRGHSRQSRTLRGALATSRKARAADVTERCT